MTKIIFSRMQSNKNNKFRKVEFSMSFFNTEKVKIIQITFINIK